ncbi:MAG: ribosomal protein S18 acetylase RimI-like enzyme [Arcticibacterium sp.]|jgi:ribosomal protein S18 acetylase RimI-like enzyme
MITFTTAQEVDFFKIQALARVIWPPTFEDILSPEQIEYMLQMMYSDDSLKKQVTLQKHTILLVEENNRDIGFLSYQLNYKDMPSTKIHKLYLLPETQGMGYGRKMIEEILRQANKENQKTISLNVNRFNKAFKFYQNLGFKHIHNEDIDIGNGFLMEDYVLELKLADD